MTTLNHPIFNPNHLVLELDQATMEQAWNSTKNAANVMSRWQAYLNQLSLDVILPWIQAEEDTSAQHGLSQAARQNVWEVVTGSAISIKGAKLVLIPSEAEDLEELRVPQEWVDLPEWAGDYYLAVQVNVDAGYVRVWGYTTHQKLKNSTLNYADRTYSLTDEDLITDINALWVARELCPEEVTQAAITPVAELDNAKAMNLVQRLGDNSQILPRMALPFATWGALIQNPMWCQKLAMARRGMPPKTPILEWFKQGVSNVTAEFGWRQIEMAPSLVGSRGSATVETTKVDGFGLAKKLIIAQRPYELRVLPLEEADSWRFELCCLTPGCLIPAGFTLRLLTEDGQSFPGNEDAAQEPVAQLSLEVDLEPEETLMWQVEPMPENYQAEVLQF